MTDLHLHHFSFILKLIHLICKVVHGKPFKKVIKIQIFRWFLPIHFNHLGVFYEEVPRIMISEHLLVFIYTYIVSSSRLINSQSLQISGLLSDSSLTKKPQLMHTFLISTTTLNFYNCTLSK